MSSPLYFLGINPGPSLQDDKPGDIVALWKDLTFLQSEGRSHTKNLVCPPNLKSQIDNDQSNMAGS
jgi:hypothetical protein